jgi:hypothetical protein
MKPSALVVAVGVLLSAIGHPAPPATAQPSVTGALLTLRDFPSGWSEEPPPMSGGGSNSLCDRPAPDRRGESLDFAEAYFGRGQLGPFVYHAVSRATIDIALDVMATVHALPVPCDWTETNRSGDTIMWQMRAISFPALGEDSVAFRLTGTLSVGSIEAEAVYFRRGDVAAVVYQAAAALFGPVNLDTALTERLARIADMRLREVAP